MAEEAEFGGSPGLTQPPVTPDGKAGHVTLTNAEILRATHTSDEDTFSGLAPLPKNLKSPKHAPNRPGAYIPDK